MILEEYLAAVDAHHLAVANAGGCWHRGPSRFEWEPADTIRWSLFIPGTVAKEKGRVLSKARGPALTTKHTSHSGIAWHRVVCPPCDDGAVIAQLAAWARQEAVCVSIPDDLRPPRRRPRR